MTLRLAAAAAVLLTATGLSSPALAEDHGPTTTATLSAPAIAYTEWHLDNGLQVIAVHDDTTSTVTTSMWYRVGAKLDPEGRAGFAHLFEHILSRKTVNMPYNMIYGLTADVGGTRNASNSMDRTNYYETVPAEYLERMLWTHRERMAFPVVDAEVFENERSVVKEELRTRVFAPPYGRFSRIIKVENGYDLLPHRRPSIGSIEELDAANLEDALAFHEAYYGPDTATLVVAGNFDEAHLRALVDQYFADIPPRANPRSIAVTIREPGRSEPRSVIAYAPNVPLPAVGTIWQLPGTAHPDVPVMELLEAIMSRGANSRLEHALVRSGLAVQLSMVGDNYGQGGLYGHFALITPDADVDAVRAVLTAETARLRDELVSEAELAEAKNEIIAGALRRRETARGRAFELAEFLMRTGNPDSADERLAIIANATREDIQRVAQTYLTPESRVDMIYAAGDYDPASFANPVPMPTFETLPPPTRTPLALRPESEREAPPAPGVAPEVGTPDLARSELANGIPVYAVQTGDVPIASLRVLLPGGGASVPREKAGLADLAASLANEGTTSRSAQEIAAQLESLGATLNGSSDSDGTTFTLTAPKANLAAAGAVMVDMIRNPVYPEDALERERGNLIEALLANKNDPSALANMVARVAVYGDAPYGNQRLGLPESLAAITQADLIAHQQAYWHPDAAQIVVAGGIAPDEAFALADELFGDWASDSAPPEPAPDKAGEALPARTIVIDAPEMGQAAVYVAGRAIPRRDAGYPALELANAVLGGGSSGRLFAAIRTERGLSYGSYSSVYSMAEAPLYTARTQTAHETVAEVAEVMLAQLARFDEEPVTPEWLDARRLYLTGQFDRARETSSGYAGIISQALEQGLDPALADDYVSQLEAVSAEEVDAAGQRFFDPDTATLIVVGKAEVFLEDLRKLRPDLVVIAKDVLDLSNAHLGAE